MKKILIALLTAFVALSANASEQMKKVYISQVIEHPALDETTRGIIEALEKEGFKRGVNLDLRVESAQGNSALASQIAAKFAAQNPDVVVGVGTTSAQSFIRYAKENRVKLIFSSVTDPLVAGLLKNLETPEANITGVSNFVSLGPQLELFQKLQPSLKRLGIIYNPGEANSVAIVNILDEVAAKFRLKIVKQVASKTADVPQAAAKLASGVDAIFISNDNNALSAFQSIIAIANKAKIPVYVSDTDAVKQGALAALGPNQYMVGFQTGKMVASILKGKSIDSMRVEFPRKTDLFINLDSAKKLGITIPAEIKSKAKLIEKEK